MKILFLSDNFPPEGNAPATRLHEHAVRWVRAGHHVTVVTCAPNFPEGRVFDGFRNRWYGLETVDGIRVVRVKTYITANEGFLRRTLDYASFMVSGFLAGSWQERPDLVVATSPQFFCAVGGYLVAAVRRRPFVFELRDLWPASIAAVGAMRNRFVLRRLESLELFLYRRAAAVVSVTESFKRDLVRRGIAADKIEVVINGVDLERYRPATAKDPELAERHGLAGKFVVGYLGTLGLAHGLPSVVRAAERLRHREDVVFLFAGGGAGRSEVVRMVEEGKLANVRILDRQPKEMMPRLWSLCDLSLIHLKDDPVFSTVIPSKLFESMGMGLPILIGLPEGEATALVRRTGVGVVVPPDRPAELAREVARLRDSPAQLGELARASAGAAASFSRDRQAQRMLDALRRVARGTRAVARDRE